jgi:hypothetical protein
MAKRHKRTSVARSVQNAPKLSEVDAALAAEYDPEIMESLLQQPGIKDTLAKSPPPNDLAMDLFKGMLVVRGVYKQYCKTGSAAAAFVAYGKGR